MKVYKVASSCGVCGEGNLESLWELPSLPLTETYGSYSPDYPNFDQDVRICRVCGHFQLGIRVNPEFLYSHENYAFKSIGSKRAVEEDLFVDFIARFTKPFVGKILEFGANDLTLAHKLAQLGRQVIAVDPLVGEASLDQRITSHPKMVEDFLDAETDVFDLVVARHTLEHVDNPRSLLSKVFNRISDDGIVALEFPSLDLITAALRGDAFFHQHYHYYDLVSVRRLAHEIDAELIGYWQNRQGSNGGSIMVALGKKSMPAVNSNLAEMAFAFGSEQASERAKGFMAFKTRFLAQMNIMMTLIENNRPVVGIGAGLMTPVYDYHLRGAIGRMPFILDDDASKHGWSYRNLNVPIMLPDRAELPADFSALITSLENPRALVKRAMELGAVKILGATVS